MCFYTWNNKHVGDRRVMSKIDRVLGNAQQEEDYSNATVTFLPEGVYDHSPMLVPFTKHIRGKKPFRFFNVQAKREYYLEVTQHVWDMPIQGCCSFQISQILKILKQRLKDKYGRDQFHKAIAKATEDLLFVQNRMHDSPELSELAAKECDLNNHLRWLQVDLKGALRQKAKLKWLKFRDDNTTFFHRSITHCIRSNSINFLQMNGEDIYDLDRIEAAFYDHFSNIFSAVPQVRSLVNINIAHNGPILSSKQGCLLDFSFF